MFQILVRLVFILLCVAPLSAAELRTMSVDGRTFDLYQPDSADDKAMPLIVALHGSGGSAKGMAQQIKLQDQADRDQFRVAYLTATLFRQKDGKASRMWNDGVCCSDGLRPDVDDSGYIARVITKLKDGGIVEGGKVAVLGHSNGAKMAYRVACEHGDLVSVLVAIAGALDGGHCTNTNGMRILNIHGAKDRRVPIAGGRSYKAPEIQHDSVAAVGKEMQNAGAAFQLIVVPEAGHSLASIDRGLQSTNAQGLADTVINFVFSR